jgi:solute carrier family 44 protein 1 (choline transporter-like protein)
MGNDIVCQYHHICLVHIKTVFIVLQIIILLLVIAMRKSISSMARVFEESAACLAALPPLFHQPFITFLALLAFFAFWVSVIVCLATSSKC